MRIKKLLWNTIISVIQQIITVICGFILPRCILKCYGTDVNGLVSSITQFLGFISFMQLGVGAVVQSSFYRPLAKKDFKELSRIFVSAERFFKKIALALIIYIIVLCFIYPNLVRNSFNLIYTDSLIIIIAIDLFAQYYFGLANQLLLCADQKAYIPLLIQVVLLVLNTVSSIGLMYLDMPIQIVKLCASLIYTLSPIIMMIYVKKNYSIDRHITYIGEPIKQKWNGFAQHLSSVIMDNTDVIILTVFSKLSNVSIYYVYHLVVFGMRQLISALTVGIQSMLGSMIALGEKEKMQNAFSNIEILFHFIITYAYTCITILLVPFVLVYTKGINDANYNTPAFGFFLSLAFASYCYALPYHAVIKAAGHYKETQNSAFIQMLLNISISVVTVVKFGLVGVAIGTLVATVYRTLYFVIYLTRNILERKIYYFIKNIILDVLCFLTTIFITRNLLIGEYTYRNWFCLASKVAGLCFVICMFYWIIGYWKIIFQLINQKNINKKNEI